MNKGNSLRAAPPMPSTRNFLVIGRHKPLVIQVLLAIRTFSDVDCFAVCERKARLLSLSRLCSSFIKMEFDGQDDDMFVDYVNRLTQTNPDLVLVPADCDGARTIGRLRNRLKVEAFPFPDEAMIDCFDNKWRFYQFCVKRGLNVPASASVASKYHLDFGPIVKEIGLPFVVKPVAECATKGVVIIHSEEEYRSKILNNDAYRYAPLIVQQYIRGMDVGLNLLAIQGKVTAISIQQREYPQYDGAKVKFLSNSYLESVAHAVAASSAYNGVMNIDARIEDGTGKVFLFESNPRFWRSLSASVWHGLNFVAEGLNPSSRSGEVHMLTSGSADTYYHPLIRHSLLRDAVFGNGHRRRMARLMMYDVCTLVGQIKVMLFRPESIGGRPDIDPRP